MTYFRSWWIAGNAARTYRRTCIASVSDVTALSYRRTCIASVSIWRHRLTRITSLTTTQTWNLHSFFTWPAYLYYYCRIIHTGDDYWIGREHAAIHLPPDNATRNTRTRTSWPVENKQNTRRTLVSTLFPQQHSGVLYRQEIRLLYLPPHCTMCLKNEPTLASCRPSFYKHWLIFIISRKRHQRTFRNYMRILLSLSLQ